MGGVGAVSGLRRVLHHPVFLTVLLAVTFVALVAPAGSRAIVDADVFWLAATGRDIVARHAMPVFNAYSYADANHPWVMHEGLYSVLLFEAARAVGPAIFVLIGVVSAACIVFVAMAYLFGQSRGTLAAAICGLMLLSGYKGLNSPRPGYAVLVLVAAMIAIAFRPGWSLGRSIGAVLVELVWTNAHGSFPLGVALLLVAAFDEGRGDRKERRARLATTGAALLVTLVNPYGWRLHGLVTRYLYADDRTAHLIQANIIGFLPLWRAWGTAFASPMLLVSLGVLVVLAVYSLARRRRVARALLVLVAAVMGVYQARNVMLAVALGALLLHGCVEELLDRWLAAPARDPRGAPWIALGIALPELLVGGALWASAMRARSPDAWIGASLGGPAFVRIMRGIPSEAHLYAPWKPSALVLWYQGDRGVQVFFDPRNDCYSPRVALAGFELGHAHVKPERVIDLLESNDTDYAIVPTPGVMADALSGSADWQVWRRDHEWLGFQRRAAP